MQRQVKLIYIIQISYGNDLQVAFYAPQNLLHIHHRWFQWYLDGL